MTTRSRVLRRVSGGRLLLILCGIIFACEALVILALAQMPPMPLWEEVLLDATVLTVALLPALYSWSFFR